MAYALGSNMDYAIGVLGNLTEGDIAMKKMKHLNFGLKKATVYFDSEWKEYTVKFQYSDGTSLFKEDYFTTDYEDAVDTALYYCNN